MKLFKQLFQGSVSTGPNLSANIPGDVAKAVGTVLKEHGFMRQGQTFRRKSGELIQIVNIQGGKYNLRNEGEFYINLAVFDGPAFEAEWGEPASDEPKEYEAQLRSKLDQYAKGKVPEEWKYDGKTDVTELGIAMGEAIVRHGLGYFDGVSSKAELLAALDSKKNMMRSIWTHITRGILLAQLGDKSAAEAELRTYCRENSMADNRIYRNVQCIGESLGIKLDLPELTGESCIGVYVPMKGKQPVHDERRTISKLRTIMDRLDDKGYGYIHYRGARKKAGVQRIAFGTKDPEYVVRYIEERRDKLALPVEIVANDRF